MKWKIAAAAICTAALCGCGRFDLLPYARELDGMALMRTLGVDAAEEGVAVTASSGTGSGGENGGGREAEVSGRSAGSISACVLDMQAEGASYVYFGHVGQLLVGESMAWERASEPLEYVLRDVEMRLDTQLYIVKGGSAGEAIRSAAEGSSAADQLEAMADGAGMSGWSMPRSVGDVLADLERCGASFAPALTVQEGLKMDGYAILKDGRLAGWAEEDAAEGIHLLTGQADADVVEVELPDGGKAALRVVGAQGRTRAVFQGEELKGLQVLCRVDANLAEGDAELRNRETLKELEKQLGEVETRRIREALVLGQSLDADFLDLQSAAGITRPWRWREIQEQWEKWSELELSIEVQAHVERSYDAER